MKMKTLGMLTMSSLLAAALTYGAPALAEDTTPTGTDAPAAQPMNNDPTQNMGSTADTTNNASAANNGGATDNSNDGTADMPSGDDDY